MKRFEAYNHSLLYIDIGGTYMVLDKKGHQIANGHISKEPTEEEARNIIGEAILSTASEGGK